MITADQLLCHAIGDYVLQSDWMAGNKRAKWIAAIVHALTYALPFLFLTRSVIVLAVIVGTHAIIDHYGLARYIVWAKNWLGPNLPWPECSGTGYPSERPPWMAVWLMIIADNILHVCINGAALRWL